MKPVLFVVHGRLKNSYSWKRIWRDVLSVQEWNPKVVFTEYSGHAAELVKEHLISQSFHALVACGGDGTLHDCLNGWMLTKSITPISILALGTGNDFVKTLGLKGTWEEVKSAVLDGHVQSCDVLRVETIDKVKFGLNVTDIGIGGSVVQGIAQDSRSWGAFLTYQKNIIKAFLRYRAKPATFFLDGNKIQKEKLFLLAFCNAKWFGSGLCIAPEARLDDGVLNVVVVDDISLWDYLRQWPKLRKGLRLTHPSVSYYSGQSIEFKEEGWPIDCDGEYIGNSPLKIEIVRQAVNILMPSTS